MSRPGPAVQTGLRPPLAASMPCRGHPSPTHYMCSPTLCMRSQPHPQGLHLPKVNATKYQEHSLVSAVAAWCAIRAISRPAGGRSGRGGCKPDQTEEWTQQPGGRRHAQPAPPGRAPQGLSRSGEIGPGDGAKFGSTHHRCEQPASTRPAWTHRGPTPSPAAAGAPRACEDGQASQHAGC